jgi:hypothetical protein
MTSSSVMMPMGEPGVAPPPPLASSSACRTAAELAQCGGAIQCECGLADLAIERLQVCSS